MNHPLTAPIYQPLPTLDQLNTWATPRLLRFYKANRNYPVRYHDDEQDRQMEQFYHYLEGIKSILNKREHVQK